MPRISTKANVTLWTLQAILALLFLFAGGSKLVLPLAALQGPIALPGVFLRFIGVCEVAGALGLILPGLFKIRPILTPLAACGLVAIMTGATTLTAANIGLAPAAIPFIVGALALVILFGRGGRHVVLARGTTARSAFAR